MSCKIKVSCGLDVYLQWLLGIFEAEFGEIIVSTVS